MREKLFLSRIFRALRGKLPAGALSPPTTRGGCNFSTLHRRSSHPRLRHRPLQTQTSIFSRYPGSRKSKRPSSWASDGTIQANMVQRTKTEGSCLYPRSVVSRLTACTGPSQAEQLLRVTSGIAAELIKAHDAGQTVSLNELRAKMSKKYGFGGVPRLVDIISAIPDDYKKALLPKLKARPIRTASGVCVRIECSRVIAHCLHIDCGGSRHVQAA